MPLCTTVHSISLPLLWGSVYFTLFPFFFCLIHPVRPGQDPEKTLDLDGARALRLHSSMGVVMGVEEADGGGRMCF